jgi:hypothetical protein
MQAFATAVGVIVAGFAAGIAYFQWRTAHQRVVLDLFDRRFGVLQRVEDAARDMVAPRNLEEAFFKFVLAEREARFLFGEDVVASLSELRGHMAAVTAFHGVAQHNDQFHAAMQEIAIFLSTKVTPLFAPYLRLDQKMPSVWWPFAWFRGIGK